MSAWQRASSILLVMTVAQASPVAAQGPIRLIIGVTDAGTATTQWSSMLKQRLPPEKHAEASGIRRPFSDDERAWLKLIRSRVALWERSREEVARPYAGVAPPEEVSVVVGNQSAPGDDAFTHDATTIGFDLGELHAAYGDAARPENAVRVDRFFRHEYAHLMQRGWLAAHPWREASPLSDALLEIWKEGLGNYHSLSGRWTENGAATQVARDTLAVLEPRFAARLAALACATPQQAATLTADLSRGPFDEKWGALPVALWLATAPGDPQAALRAFVEAGPAGVWALASRRLPAPLPAVVREARDAADRCQAAAR
jgi:hypothetical protein